MWCNAVIPTRNTTEQDMTKITYIKRGHIQAITFIDTTDQAKARMIAEMQAGRGVRVVVEAV